MIALPIGAAAPAIAMMNVMNHFVFVFVVPRLCHFCNHTESDEQTAPLRLRNFGDGFLRRKCPFNRRFDVMALVVGL